MNTFDLHPHYLYTDYLTKDQRARVEEIGEEISALITAKRRLEEERDAIYAHRREHVLRFALQHTKRTLKPGQIFILQPDATSLLKEEDFEGLIVKSHTLTMTKASFCFSLEPDGSFDEFELTHFGEWVVNDEDENEKVLVDQIKAQKLDTWDVHAYPKESTLPLGCHEGKCTVFVDIDYICLSGSP